MSKTNYLRLASTVLALTLSVFATGAILKTLTWPVVTKSSASGAANDPNEPIQNIRFTVYDVGIYPQEMQVDVGRVSIVFDDRTGKSTGFVVERINGNNSERVGEIRSSTNHLRTRGQVQLEAGRYRVFSSERPEIQSTLIVNP